MSTEGRVGWAALVMGCFGVASFWLWPDERSIGWFFLVASAVFALIWGYCEIRPFAKEEAIIRRICACAFLGLVFILAIKLAWPRHKPLTISPKENTTQTTLASVPQAAEEHSSTSKSGSDKNSTRTGKQDSAGHSAIKPQTETPEVKQGIVRELADFSKDILDFANKCELKEQALPSDDLIRSAGDKSDTAWVQWELYHRRTMMDFLRETRLKFRCDRITKELQYRTVDQVEVSQLIKSCGGANSEPPSNSIQLKNISSLVTDLMTQIPQSSPVVGIKQHPVP
jgi:hypothetical protein